MYYEQLRLYFNSYIKNQHILLLRNNYLYSFNTRKNHSTQYFTIGRSSRPEVFCKKGVLKNFTKLAGKHLCQRLFFKKESLAQMFSCEFCEISKNTFFYRTPLVAASEQNYKL